MADELSDALQRAEVAATEDGRSPSSAVALPRGENSSAAEEGRSRRSVNTSPGGGVPFLRLPFLAFWN